MIRSEGRVSAKCAAGFPKRSCAKKRPAAPGEAGAAFGIKGGSYMATAVNAGARLDRLPISSFHYRIFWLVGAGMFFDGYDLYIAGGVLASTVQSKFSTVPQNLQFISLTFVGMTLGALITGFVGDRMGRRFTYQINLL